MIDDAVVAVLICRNLILDCSAAARLKSLFGQASLYIPKRYLIAGIWETMFRFVEKDHYIKENVHHNNKQLDIIRLRGGVKKKVVLLGGAHHKVAYHFVVNFLYA